MKVMQILPSLEVGGVERGVVDLARAMKRLGHETVVVSSGGSLVQELKKMGVTHYELPVHKKSWRSLFLIPKIEAIIQKEQIEMVHARSRVPAWLAWFAARKTGRPFLTTCHGYYSTHFLSRIMGWGKRVIVISRIIGRHMIDHFGVSPDRIRLIHRGVDISQFHFRELAKISGDSRSPRPFRVINIGRFSPIKGQVEFLKAVHIVRSQIPALEVWLVGSEGKGKHKYTDLIEETIKQLGLESCVKRMGTRRDIPELLSQSDLLVLSTLVPEAFGRVIVEAGAVGTPVISTEVGGVLDIIDQEQNGLLVPPGDIEGMAQAIVRMLKNRDEAQRFAHQLRKKIENEFTLEKMVQKNIEVYEEVRRKKKILVVKLGAMGDLILAVPSLRMLHDRFPNATLGLLVDKNLASLVSSLPYLSEAIPVDRTQLSHLSYLLKLAKKLRKEGYEISVDLQNSKWTHLLCFFGGIPERYGFARGRFGFLVNRPDHSYDAVESPVKNQFRVLSKLGVRKCDERLELFPDEESEKKIEGFLGSIDPLRRSKAVGLVIGSSAKWPTKRWPVEYFKRLAERLIQEAGCPVLLIGSKEDEALAQEFEPLQSLGVLNLAGKTSPRDLVSLMKRLSVVVSGDTAPLHVASAMDTKIIALFGPTDPKRHMPPAPSASVYVRTLECQPCYDGICKNKEMMACLTRISVDEVYDAILKQLNGQ